MLLQARKATVHSERRHPHSDTANQLPSSSASLPRRPFAEVENICGQRHVRVVLSLVRDLALDGNGSQRWKPHRTHLQLQLPRLLGGVEQGDRGDKAGRLSNHWCHTWYGTADRPSTPPWEPEHERRQRTETDGNRSAACFDTSSEHGSPSVSGLPILCLEMRKRVAQRHFPLHSHQQCSNASHSVNQFLPRRPRGAYFMVLSSGACKVGRRIRQRGFLVGWYQLNLGSTDLRRLRSDVRTGRVLGAFLFPSCASWSHC